MEVKTLISVIVPIYNVEPYLEQCIESIVNQTYTNLEIILVDDGSTDGGGRICDEYVKKDKRVKVIHKKNGGLVSTRKAGIQIATGDYATYVDGDDWLEEDAYESLVTFFQGEAPDIISYGMEENYTDKVVVCKNKIPAGYYSGEKMKSEIHPYMLYSGEFYEFGVIPNIWAKLVKRDLLLECQMAIKDKVNIGEDAICNMAVFLKAKSCILSDKILYHYRKRMDSMMGSSVEWERIRALFQNLKEVLLKGEEEYLFFQLYKYMFFVLLLKQYEMFLQKPLEGLTFGDLKNKKIVLYGAGGFGTEVYSKIQENSSGKIVLWVDKRYESYQAENLPVESMEELKTVEYDMILITILNTKVCEIIQRDLIQAGVAPEKIRYVVYSKECEEAMKKILQDM